MKILDRILHALNPDACEHKTELARISLIAGVPAGTERLSQALARRINDLRDEVFHLASAKGELQVRVDWLAGEVGELTARETVLRFTIDELQIKNDWALATQRALEARLEDKGLSPEVTDREIDKQLILLRSAQQAAGEKTPPNPDAEDALLTDSTSEDAYRLVGVWFEGRHFWELTRDNKRIKVPVLDADWLKDVRDRKFLFGAGDSVRVLMRTMTFEPADGGDLYVKQSVVKVLEVKPPAQQQALVAGAEVAHA